MNSSQRLWATLRGEPVDRLAVNFYEIGGFAMHPADQDHFNVYNDPSWKPLIDLAETQTDLIRMRSPVRTQSHQAWDISSPSTDSIRSNFFSIQSFVEGNSGITRTIVTVNGHVLTSLTKRHKDVDTVWTVEHLLKSTDDIETYLQIPDEVFDENIEISSLLKEEQQLGERGIVMVDTEDPLCTAATLLSMEDFTVIALTEQKLFHRLLEKCARYIHARTERVAKEFPGRLWRIYGPEFATEPYLPPSLFNEYVVRYTGPMVEMIKKYKGVARIHCHGRIRNILKYIVKMGADAIDPVEPPPHGDIDLASVRKEYGRDLVLFGNIEVADIENTKPEEFEKIVEKALEEGTRQSGRGFVLTPTASPYGRNISKTTFENYQIMVEKVYNFRF